MTTVRMTRPDRTDGASARAIWWRVAIRLRPYRWLVCLTALLVLLLVALSMASPLLLRYVIDDALPRHDGRLLVVLCVAMIASGALGTGMAVALSLTVNWVGQQVVHGLRMEVYDRVQRMPLDFFAAEPTAEIQARMSGDIGGISDILTYTASSTLTAAASMLTAGLVMLVLSWPLAVTCLVLASVLGLFNRRFDAARQSLAGQQREHMADLLKLAGEDLTLSGIILGRTFVRHAAQRSRFRASSAAVRDVTYRQRMAGSSARGVIGLTLACLPPLIYLLAGIAIPGLSVGTAVVMVTLQLRLTGPIQQLLGLSGQAQSARAMFQRVFDYVDLPSATEPELGGGETRVAPAYPATSLRLVNVQYHYAGSERTALSQVDLEIPSGSTIVITGHTGSGKSTLALIMAGLVTPCGGAVEVAASSERSTRWQLATSQDLWQSVTLVAQESVMFNASMRENLLFARPDATDRQVRQAADAMQLGDLIAKLPAGLDTMVGERGYQLSGGERQRLALARALLAPSSILILDEATSALDNFTAAAVHSSLQQLREHRTLIIITHRVPQLARADQTIVLSDGRITQAVSTRGRAGVQE